MTNPVRWSLTVAAVALMAGLSGPAVAGATPEQVTAALTKLLSNDKGTTFNLGTPTEADGNVVFNNVSIKSNDGADTKIEVLTFGNPTVDGDTLSADAIAAENVTAVNKGDTITASLIEIMGPVFTGKETGNRADSFSAETIAVNQPGKAPVTIGSVGVDLSDYVGDVPHAIDVSVDGVSLDPATVDESGQFAAQLKAMGYDKLELGFFGSGSLDEASGDLVLNELTLDGTDLGTVTLSGTVGGFTSDVIAELRKENTPPEVLEKLTLKNASVYYGDASLAGRVIAMQAKAVGQEPAAFVDQLTGALPLFLMVIGNQPFQDKLAQGLTTFLKDPKNITVTADPSAPIGLIALFVAAQTAPQSLPDMLKADVLANQAEENAD